MFYHKLYLEQIFNSDTVKINNNSNKINPSFNIMLFIRFKLTRECYYVVLNFISREGSDLLVK
jgi:hypothetical protein